MIVMEHDTARRRLRIVEHLLETVDRRAGHTECGQQLGPRVARPSSDDCLHDVDRLVEMRDAVGIGPDLGSSISSSRPTARQKRCQRLSLAMPISNGASLASKA